MLTQNDIIIAIIITLIATAATLYISDKKDRDMIMSSAVSLSTVPALFFGYTIAMILAFDFVRNLIF